MAGAGAGAVTERCRPAARSSPEWSRRQAPDLRLGLRLRPHDGGRDGLRGINPHCLSTTTWIEYGTTPALGSTVAGPGRDVLTYEKGVVVALSGPSPATTYCLRLAASNAGGTARGPMRTFVTLG